MLKANHTAWTREEKTQCGHVRRLKLEQALDKIRAANTPLIDTLILSQAPRSGPSSNAPTVRVSHQCLFPLPVDLLEYPIIKSLDEMDVPDSEMQARFEGYRKVVKAHILEWSIKIKGHMAGLL